MNQWLGLCPHLDFVSPFFDANSQKKVYKKLPNPLFTRRKKKKLSCSKDKCNKEPYIIDIFEHHETGQQLSPSILSFVFSFRIIGFPTTKRPAIKPSPPPPTRHMELVIKHYDVSVTHIFSLFNEVMLPAESFPFYSRN